MNYFDEIFNRIKDELNLKSDKEMYDYMGIIQGTFTNWRRRNKIPYEEINSICINNNFDLNYILNGKKKTICINFKEENHKMIEELEEKQLEETYYFLKNKKLNK